MGEAPRVGIVGGGQLGRMLALAGAPLGIRTTVLDPSRDACAAAVADQIVAPYDDKAALSQLAERSDVVTFEFENVPAAAVRELAEHQRVEPDAAALAVSQDRLAEKQLFGELGITTARNEPVDDEQQLRNVAAAFGGPLVLKTRRFGYDGKGQTNVQTAGDVTGALKALEGAPAIAEALVEFTRELSQVSVRSRDGMVLHYPLVENVHRDGILRETRAPADGVNETTASQARGYMEALMAHLGYVGVLALELFDTPDGLLANELAPRVHNSGHWTIDGAACSQFENHLRAVCGLPLGEVALREPCTMLNLIGGVPPLAELAAVPGARIHLYDKQSRPGRKVGHVTLLGGDGDEFERHLAALRELVESHNS